MNRYLAAFCLLSLPISLAAQSPPSTAVPATANGAQSALDKLVGKAQIVGITKIDGTRVLGRILASNHGLYIVQSFHFAGPPQHQTERVGSGRHQRTKLITKQTTIPDDNAVRLLMMGVEGSIQKPREIQAERFMITPQDLKYLQALSPPSKKKSAGKSTLRLWTMTTLWPTTAVASQTP